MSKDTFIPLADMADAGHERIVWRVNLPDYAPSEGITINADKLSKLAKLGGLESVRIESYSGDTTQVVPDINDINEQGVASAANKASVIKADTHKAEMTDNFTDDLPYEYQWRRGNISLNIAEMDERVGQKNKLRDPKAWSKQLDKSLRQGIIENSWESLIRNSPGFSKAKPALALGAFTLMEAVLFGSRGSELLVRTAEDLLFYNLIIDHYVNKLAGDLPSYVGFKDRKQSALTGLAFDRHLAAKTLAAYGKIAKPA